MESYALIQSSWPVAHVAEILLPSWHSWCLDMQDADLLLDSAMLAFVLSSLFPGKNMVDLVLTRWFLRLMFFTSCGGLHR